MKLEWMPPVSGQVIDCSCCKPVAYPRNQHSPRQHKREGGLVAGHPFFAPSIHPIVKRIVDVRQ
jgi:hypothetical protein